MGMMRLGLESIRREGLLSTLKKVMTLRSIVYQRLMLRAHVLSGKFSLEEKFSWIYSSNYWGNEESRSGNGSSLAYTSGIRQALPKIFEKYSIQSIFDAPCGDFNWMRSVVGDTDITYGGGDIVPELIKKLQAEFGRDNLSFTRIDLTANKMPKSDLFFCRDLLFHLSFEDAKKVLENFLESGTPYIMTTTHQLNDSQGNHDIVSGDFRLLDLTKEPFLLPKKALETVSDYKHPDPERYMKIWGREEVFSSIKKRPLTFSSD